MEENERERKSRKHEIVLGIIFVSVITVIGLIASVAYYVTSTSGTDQTLNVGSAKLRVVYKDCLEENQTLCANVSKNLSPGENITKEFEITNDSTVAANFAIYFKELINTYKNNELVYTLVDLLTSQKLVENKVVPSAETSLASTLIANNISLDAGATRRYRLTVTFINTGYNQNENLNATFSFKTGIGDKVEE